MDLTHRFSVPASIDEAWTALTDIERVAPCFPGATLTTVQGTDFAGSVKVKLGPSVLAYNGSGSFDHVNDRSHRAVLDVRGVDRRDNGTATAKMTISLTDRGATTDVEVKTDLALTGRAARLGRGVVSDGSDRLIAQFVGCLGPKFADGLGRADYAGVTRVGSDVAGTGSAPTGGPGTATRTRYTPPANASQPHVDVVRAVMPAVRRYGPLMATSLAVFWVLTRILGRSKTD